MILIQPLFIVFMGVVPSLCLRVGYTTMMTVSLVYLYSVPASDVQWWHLCFPALCVEKAWTSQVLIILNLSIAFSDILPVMMLVAFTLVGGDLT